MPDNGSGKPLCYEEIRKGLNEAVSCLKGRRVECRRNIDRIDQEISLIVVGNGVHNIHKKCPSKSIDWVMGVVKVDSAVRWIFGIMIIAHVIGSGSRSFTVESKVSALSPI